MSRSYRRTPIVGFSRVRSERFDKKQSAKRVRATGIGEEGSLAPAVPKQSRTWGFAKDGKHFIQLHETSQLVANAKGITPARATRRLMGK